MDGDICHLLNLNLCNPISNKNVKFQETLSQFRINIRTSNFNHLNELTVVFQWLVIHLPSIVKESTKSLCLISNLLS